MRWLETKNKGVKWIIEKDFYRMMNDKNWSMIITSYNARKIIFGSCKYGGNNVELAIIIYTPIVKRIELNGDPKRSDSHSSSSMALAKHVPKIWSPKTFKRNAQNVWSNFAIPFQYSSLKNYFIKFYQMKKTRSLQNILRFN